MNNAVRTVTIASAPHDAYKSVKERRCSSDKDQLVYELIDSSISAAYSDISSVEACQKQCEIIQDWCSSSPLLSEAQLNLISNILSLSNVTSICVLSLAPVFNFYVIGTTDDTDLYDLISRYVVHCQYEHGLSAAYIYMTEMEFKNCDIDGVIETFHR